MTPFGRRIRELRHARGITQKEMARALGVSPAYLSALEHGRRGLPSWALLQKMVGYFNVIWDEAEELQALAAMSDPRVVVDTSGLSEQAVRLANLVAAEIGVMEEDELGALCERIAAGAAARRSRRGVSEQG